MIRLGLIGLKKDIKSSAFYMIVMALIVMINFIFLAAENGKALFVERVQIMHPGPNLAKLYDAVAPSGYLNMVILVFCCFLMFYVNNNYIYNKKSEIAVLMVSGASTFKIIVYFLTQITVLFVLASIPGIILGYIGTNYFLQLVAQLMNTTPTTVDTTKLTQIIVLTLVILVYLALYVCAYVYHVDVKDLLATQSKVKMINNPPKHKIINYAGFVFFLLGVGLILYPDMPYDNMSTQLFLCFIGLLGVLNGFISRLVMKWKMKKSFTQSFFTVAVSNYSSTLLTGNMTILMLIFATIMMFFVTLTFSSQMNEFILAFSGYLIAIVLLSFTLVFDFMVQAKQRVVYYINLWKIGYTRKNLVRIIREELSLLFLTILILTLLVICPLGYRFVTEANYSLSFCLFMIGFFIGFIIFIWILTYILYRNTIYKSIIEEK